ncbi:MAG: biotin transporter BioY [Clostridia bacterium]|nr:biotin transporter BioY [Clostridia bacterium]
MRKSFIYDVTLIALFAAFISICSFITIPVFTVPITLQSFAIMSALLILGGVRGTVAVALYIAIGAVGLPVFSGFTGGIGRLFDATGGFIIGFLAASLVYLLITSLFSDAGAVAVIATVVAQLTVYLCGWLWFSAVYSDGAYTASLLTVVLPFVLPDAVKLVLAHLVAAKIKKYLKI